MGVEQKESGSSGVRAPDAYEARYMAGEGVLHRDKFKAPRSFFLLLLLPVVIQTLFFASLMLAPAPAPPQVFLALPLTALVVAVIGLLFSVLRITVTRKEIIVQYGLFGPKIPIEQVRSCKAVHYDWKDYGGWGIRRARDGSWAYNMMGDAGRAVRVEWLDDQGKTQVALLTSRDPEALVRAVAEARGAARPGLRVADPSLAEFEAEAEAEAESVMEEERSKKLGEPGGGSS